MVAYEIYWRDEIGRDHLIGILPERRKSPERITEKSILNWGRKVISDNTGAKEIYYYLIEMD